MIAPWPAADISRRDATIEARFARFQEVLRGLREIRARQNIPPKTPIAFAVRCDEPTADLLRPMSAYFKALTGAAATAWGPVVEPPPARAHVSMAGVEVYVDLAGLIDVPAEIAKNEREREKLVGLVAAKEKKLANESFTSRAPPDVIGKERDALAELRARLASIEQSLELLRRQG
jgi:valyl-tRNA synthetase